MRKLSKAVVCPLVLVLVLIALGGSFSVKASYAQITSPTSAAPVFVTNAEDTDVMIVCHFDSAEVDALTLDYGMYAALTIFHEDDLSDPVYRYFDPNVLPTSAGESRVFHWNGFTHSSARALPGKYTVRMSLYNHNFEPTDYSYQENNAIIIEVCDVTVADTSDALLSRHGAMAGEDGLNLHYVLSHAVAYDEVAIKVYDADDTLIAGSSSTTDLDGTVVWNGWTLEWSIVEPGSYTAELEIKRRGLRLATSERHPFMVYEVDLRAADTLEGDEESPGVFLPAGQETTVAVHFRPEAAGLSGVVHLADVSASDAVSFVSASGPVDLTSGLDVPLSDAETGVVITARSIQLNPVPVELVADYLPLAAPPQKRERDKVVLVLSGIDLDVDADRDGVVETNYEDDIDEDQWAVGAANKGAIVLVNSDDDDHDHLPDNWSVHPEITHTEWDDEPFDNTINNDLDVEDIAPLIVRKIDLAAFPDDARITLRVAVPPDDPTYFSGFTANQRVRVFLPNQTSGGDLDCAAGAQEIIGPQRGDSMEFVDSPGPLQGDISIFLGDGDVRFGMEGIVHASMVDVIIEYRQGTGVYCQDKVRIRNAPYIHYSHIKEVQTSTDAGETVFVESWYGSDELRDRLKSRFDSSHVDEAFAGDIWHQDGYDPGYQSAPYGSMPMILGLPRGQRGGDDLNHYAQNELLRPGVGLVHNFQYEGGGGEGGNLEAIPGSPEQFLHGSHNMTDAVTDFLTAQGVQREKTVDTSFLNVGHVDELVCFAPDGRHVLVSSPEVAWALLLIAANIDEDAIMLRNIDPLDVGGATVTQILNDYEDYNFNVVLDPFNLPKFRQALGLGSATSQVQAGADNSSDHLILSRAGGLIGFMNGNRTRAFRLTFTSDTEFNLEYRDGEDPWVLDGSGTYGEHFISDSKTAFILDRWWRPETPSSGDIYFFSVNPRSAFIEVPVIFREVGGALAFTNNNVNSLVSGDTIITAETAGPVVDWGDGARDIFGYYLEHIFARAGYSNTVFADETEYHNLHGSIHCGTNVLRYIPSRHWWE